MLHFGFLIHYYASGLLPPIRAFEDFTLKSGFLSFFGFHVTILLWFAFQVKTFLSRKGADLLRWKACIDSQVYVY